jgi:hypothetical protein
VTEQLWAFEIERMGMSTDLDPHIDSLLSAVGDAIDKFRNSPFPLREWLQRFDTLMDWVEKNQIECSVSYELIGHGVSHTGKVAHVRLMLVMDEKTATLFRLYHPETKHEPFERHWKECKLKWPRVSDDAVCV